MPRKTKKRTPGKPGDRDVEFQIEKCEEKAGFLQIPRIFHKKVQDGNSVRITCPLCVSTPKRYRIRVSTPKKAHSPRQTGIYRFNLSSKNEFLPSWVSLRSVNIQSFQIKYRAPYRFKIQTFFILAYKSVIPDH